MRGKGKLVAISLALGLVLSFGSALGQKMLLNPPSGDPEISCEEVRFGSPIRGGNPACGDISVPTAMTINVLLWSVFSYAVLRITRRHSK